jgi:hypothetical protein
MNKIIPYLIGFVVFGLTFGLIGGAIYYNFIDEGFDFDNEGVESIGYLSWTSCGSRSSMWVTHSVDGKEFEGPISGCIYKAQFGELYKIKYNRDNPKEIRIEPTEMFFGNDEKIDTTEGYIQKFRNGQLFETPKFVEAYFYYWVDNIEYDRGQEINYEKQKKLKTGIETKYKVVYSVTNPRKAKILFDDN